MGDTTMAKIEPWSDVPDEDHPIRWESKGNDPTRYVTWDEALRRLQGYGHVKTRAHDLLLQGHKLDTTFATYEFVR